MSKYVACVCHRRSVHSRANIAQNIRTEVTPAHPLFNLSLLMIMNDLLGKGSNHNNNFVRIYRKKMVQARVKSYCKRSGARTRATPAGLRSSPPNELRAGKCVFVQTLAFKYIYIRVYIYIYVNVYMARMDASLIRSFFVRQEILLYISRYTKNFYDITKWNCLKCPLKMVYWPSRPARSCLV